MGSQSSTQVKASDAPAVTQCMAGLKTAASDLSRLAPAVQSIVSRDSSEGHVVLLRAVKLSLKSSDADCRQKFAALQVG